jgi:UDP-N-acetylglucosamine 2-epimerase (non-hydrolysing)
MLGGAPQISLVEPLDYPELVAAMLAAKLILTDSGGIQEEAPALARPVLVLRAVTERPEAVEIGAAKLVGSSRAAIVAEASRLLTDADHYAAMAPGRSPYGDGRAAQRIRDRVCSYLRPEARPAR